MKPYKIAAFYRFVDLPDFENLQQPIKDTALKHDITGMILLAREGINSTVAGHEQNVHNFLNALQQDERFQGLSIKFSEYHKTPFRKMKVRLKEEIVRIKAPLPAKEKTQIHVDATTWEKLLQDDETLVLDARNNYEINIGTFKGAVNPQTECFSELPQWLVQKLEQKPYKKIAMFCTGGIRCEKLAQHLDTDIEICQLEGGILKYLEETKNKNKLWQGECFIFDNRLALNDNLEGAEGRPCPQCGAPFDVMDIISWRNDDALACQNCRETTLGLQTAVPGQ